MKEQSIHMFHRFLGGVRLRFEMILTVTRILEEEDQMSAIIFLKKKVASKVLSFLFLLAPFISKQKKNAEKDQPLTGRYLDNIEAVR